jgi:hypothetical protein
VSRLQSYGPKGVLLSDVHLSDWQPLAPAPVDPAQPAAPDGSVNAFPRAIRIDRPHDDYRLDLQITKVTLNVEIPTDRFKLDQPAGSELVRVGENEGDKAQ